MRVNSPFICKVIAIDSPQWVSVAYDFLDKGFPVVEFWSVKLVSNKFKVEVGNQLYVTPSQINGNKVHSLYNAILG